MAASHAMPHCPSTTARAHFPPSSRRMEAMAATQGVYSRLKTSMLAADRAPRLSSPSAKSTPIEETTLSFARKPLTSEVAIRQSPRPIGRSTGTRNPAMVASMESAEFSTRLKRKSKLFRNQTRMVEIRMMENARCRKSLDFSHISCTVDRMLGRR